MKQVELGGFWKCRTNRKSQKGWEWERRGGKTFCTSWHLEGRRQCCKDHTHEVKMGSEDGILQPGKYYKDPETAKEKEIKEPGA